MQDLEEEEEDNLHFVDDTLSFYNDLNNIIVNTTTEAVQTTLIVDSDISAISTYSKLKKVLFNIVLL